MAEETQSSGTQSNLRPNRRRYLRYQDATVQVQVRGSGLLGRFRAETCPMIDFNRFGLSFVHDGELELESRLLLDVDAGSLSLSGLDAEVRVCAPHSDGWRIGVEFDLAGLRKPTAEKRASALHELEKALKRR